MAVLTKMKTADEYDAFCSRQWHHWKPGTLKKIKRAFNKRVRQDGKKEAHSDDG